MVVVVVLVVMVAAVRQKNGLGRGRGGRKGEGGWKKCKSPGAQGASSETIRGDECLLYLSVTGVP